MIDILLFVGLAIVGLALGYLAFNALLTRRLAAKAERDVPMSGRLIDIDGDRLHVVEQGEGRPIVFIHGLGAQLHHFTGTIVHDLAADFRLVAVDRPGSGYSVRGADKTGALTEQADTIAQLLDRLDVEKPLIVGHSLGGMIALTRLPSLRRASTSGLDSSMRRPMGATIRSITPSTA